MRYIPIVLILSVLAVLAANPVRAEDTAHLWRICAQSEIIVEGTISVPLDQTGHIQIGSDGYTTAFVKVGQTLKGPTRSSLLVQHYAKSDKYSVPIKNLIELDGRKAVLFLVSASRGDVHREWYFAGYRDGLRPASIELTKSIEAEVERQTTVLHNWQPATRSMTRDVRALIEQTVHRKTELTAFRRLEDLGQPAVPAIIDLMDDRRELPIRQISLRNFSPHAFEGIRHYGPKKVVDALAAILNQITSESFGFIYNGATNDERARTVAGWRVYQDILLNHPEWLRDK